MTEEELQLGRMGREALIVHVRALRQWIREAYENPGLEILLPEPLNDRAQLLLDFEE